MKIGKFSIEREEPDIWKGLVAGMVAGLFATYVKDKFQTLLTNIEKAENPPRRPSAEGPKPQAQEEPTTVKAANIVAKKVLHRNLRKKEKDIAGPLVDYGFGTVAGMAYGAAAEMMPAATAAGGSGFGTALWLAADEIGVPATGLSKWPTNYPMKTHAYALTGHIVYGMAAELARRIVRKALD